MHGFLETTIEPESDYFTWHGEAGLLYLIVSRRMDPNPTVKMQHNRLITMHDCCEKIPLDYTSYHIHMD